MNHSMHNRRGMLLLLVLSMLTLFLMMGVTLLVVATRARTASRAFMNATSGMDVSPGIPRMLLDEALLLLVRGSKDQQVNEKVITESLLKDIYESNDNKVPFRDEQHDGFDSSNLFLTQFGDDGSVSKAAFQGNQGNGKIEVDNDGDGEPDGVWLPDPAINPAPKFLPEMASSTGGTLTFKVSYLVRDLDGRINVNAHGGAGAGDPLGPATIDGSGLEAFAGNAWAVMQNGGAISHGGGSGHEDLREPPVIGRDLEGRGGSAYGLRLDRKATPPAGSSLTTVQPFSLGELERVLRPFDRDWSTLPPRLSAILSDPDHAAREMVTTDSWDVPYRTGAAAPPTGSEPVLKFDLTTPAPADKQAFATALFNAIKDANVAGPGRETAQWCANVAEFRDPGTGAASMPANAFGLPDTDPPIVGVKPDVLRVVPYPWDGGLVSSADLIAIPKGDKAAIDALLDATPPGSVESLVALKPEILNAVHVPTRFTATFNQEPVREPGRVNVNTCTGDVWDTVVDKANLSPSPAKPSNPVHSMWTLLKETSFTGGNGDTDVRNVNRPLANRLASLATVRSNVFAVWITIEVDDSAATAGDPTCYRLFSIVDRSIPVNYKQGENTNVHETIRLKRFLN
jgi:hypothetical protein